ncbi:MAG: DUF3291 domain-containing protein [Pseudomonadota bacterium]
MTIAQFNIARARWPLEDPRMAEFTDMIDRMNAVAARSPGYVWRLIDENGLDAPKFPGDPRMTFTLSVWDDVESLRMFTWNTIHKRFRLRRDEWFEPLGMAYLAIWPIDRTHRPDGQEALEKLAVLRRHGPTPSVFGTEALVSKDVVDA